MEVNFLKIILMIRMPAPVWIRGRSVDALRLPLNVGEQIDIHIARVHLDETSQVFHFPQPNANTQRARCWWRVSLLSEGATAREW